MPNRYSLSDDRRRNPLGSLVRIILELIIIVIGIYIAFQLENNREANNKADLERNYLEQLLDEVVINEGELLADQDARKEQLVYLRKLLETPLRQVDTDTIRKAMDLLLMIRLYSPTDAVYQDLVSSGNLGIIKSDAFKRVLMNYRRALSRVPSTENRDLQLITNILEPYLLDKEMLSFLELYGDVDEIGISNDQKDRMIRQLLRERRFIDMVYLRINTIQDVIFFENPMQWHLRAMRNLLRGELGLPPD
ncbi:hypothetical protein BFP97_03405 [Roseivirga sp. 4D4]|uniref:hypothetical protein n=1 Tax=Roseivirga sp. 4D4 TaxID=1889784 RepID=UPI000853A5CE|nr:hypothetical protein [Roseivirga sp. 4D4]OEK00608.1 hypothetical protein BFP97_03405 [Roseivirga sp. 4D4]